MGETDSDTHTRGLWRTGWHRVLLKDVDPLQSPSWMRWHDLACPAVGTHIIVLVPSGLPLHDAFCRSNPVPSPGSAALLYLLGLHAPLLI